MLNAAAVRRLAKRWLAAQNRQDFRAYEALYAIRFFGVKRIGQRSLQYNRAGWIADRRRMFGRKMVVKIEGLTVRMSSGSAVLGFTQTWASGAFKDRGTKQLVVVAEGGALRISREEMLASRILNRAPMARLPAERFSFVVALGRSKQLGLVIGRETLASWGRGPIHSVSRGAAANRAVNRAKLPAALASWAGRKVTIYSATGKACGAQVQKLLLLTRAEPHFLTRSQWEGREGGPRKTDAQVARELWDLAGTRGRVLVAMLDQPLARCGGALWGRDARLPVPVIYAKDRRGRRARQARKQLPKWFRRLAGVAVIQREYVKELTAVPGLKGRSRPRAAARPGMWFKAKGSAAQQLHVIFKHPAKPAWIASFSARTGQGCGSFLGEYWAAWRLGPRRQTLLSDPGKSGFVFYPLAVVDVDGDGTPELISTDTVMRLQGGVLRRLYSIEPPSFDCPC